MPVSCIIPAFNAADTVGATVRGARSIPEVAQVIVVDDGSSDETSSAAAAAGADQIIHFPANQGKGAALAAGVAAAAHPRLLFLDADLGASASHAGVSAVFKSAEGISRSHSSVSSNRSCSARGCILEGAAA